MGIEMNGLWIALAVLGAFTGIVASFIRSFSKPASSTYRVTTIVTICGILLIALSAFLSGAIK
jgi:bacteriorhodopsin